MIPSNKLELRGYREAQESRDHDDAGDGPDTALLAEPARCALVIARRRGSLHARLTRFTYFSAHVAAARYRRVIVRVGLARDAAIAAREIGQRTKRVTSALSKERGQMNLCATTRFTT